jgi:hypothetical protein
MAVLLCIKWLDMHMCAERRNKGNGHKNILKTCYLLTSESSNELTIIFYSAEKCFEYRRLHPGQQVSIDLKPKNICLVQLTSQTDLITALNIAL